LFHQHCNIVTPMQQCDSAIAVHKCAASSFARCETVCAAAIRIGVSLHGPAAVLPAALCCPAPHQLYEVMLCCAVLCCSCNVVAAACPAGPLHVDSLGLHQSITAYATLTPAAALSSPPAGAGPPASRAV
jgi:hypothetical protein